MAPQRLGSLIFCYHASSGTSYTNAVAHIPDSIFAFGHYLIPQPYAASGDVITRTSRGPLVAIHSMPSSMPVCLISGCPSGLVRDCYSSPPLPVRLTSACRACHVSSLAADTERPAFPPARSHL